MSDPDTILGCLLGGALGDAAGASRENGPAGAGEIVLGPVTDDTQLTLATCEAIIEAGSPDPGVIAASVLRWFRSGRLTGLGASTLKALRDLDAGAHWALSGRKGDRAAGNGAAMRIAPLAFCLDPHQESSRTIVRDVSRITHHHDEAYAGALAVVLAVHSRLTMGEIAARLPDTSVRDRIGTYAELSPGASITGTAQRLGCSGFVVDSVPLAIFAARQVDELGFVPMLEQLLAAGGDTDTNAAIAGQIAGAAIGLSELPRTLLAQLPEFAEIAAIAHQFVDAVNR